MPVCSGCKQFLTQSVECCRKFCHTVVKLLVITLIMASACPWSSCSSGKWWAARSDYFVAHWELYGGSSNCCFLFLPQFLFFFQANSWASQLNCWVPPGYFTCFLHCCIRFSLSFFLYYFVSSHTVGFIKAMMSLPCFSFLFLRICVDFGDCFNTPSRSPFVSFLITGI